MGDKMEAYIGCKVILAEPMDKNQFEADYKGGPTEYHKGEEGYHVQYSNPDGSTYDSWSPKDVFERAYRPVSEDEKALIVN